MAHYTITHSCGHHVTVNLVGKSSDRERKQAWLQTIPCPSCQRAAETVAAQALADATDLPALVGSEKQVAWATRIRADLLTKLSAERERFAAVGQRTGASAEQVAVQMGAFDLLVANIKAQTAASWWIDRRDASAMTILRDGHAAEGA